MLLQALFFHAVVQDVEPHRVLELPAEDRFGNPLESRKSRSPVASAKQPRANRRELVAPETKSRCPPGMVYVVGGTFNRRRLTAFCFDEHEVTVGAFALHVERVENAEPPSGAQRGELRKSLQSVSEKQTDASRSASSKRARSEHCTWHTRELRPDLPVNCVSQEAAEAYCKAQGKRLPLDREWQWAARNGAKGTTYPWGNSRPSRFNINMAEAGTSSRIVEVKRHAKSLGGLHDLAGNVWEWTACDQAQGETGCKIRGGSFRTEEASEVRVTSFKDAYMPSDRSEEIGFRCMTRSHGGVKAR